MSNNEDLSKLASTCVSDAMDGLNHMNVTIKPLDENWHVVGKAFTVQVPQGENLSILEALDQAEPGDVLVVDGKADMHNALAGDFVLGMAKTLGIQGMIVDGVIRDKAASIELGFPVFCKGTVPAAGRKASRGQVNVPIQCGGVIVNPGDLIVADADGVVVVPQEIEEEIKKKSFAKLIQDDEREATVNANEASVRKHLAKVLGK